MSEREVITLLQGQLADGNSIRRHVRPIVLALLVGVVCFVAARLSHLLMTPQGVSVFWPAAGVSSGILIALGPTARWPVAIGVIAATLAAYLTGNVLSSSIFALSDAGGALLVAWFVGHCAGSDFSLGRLRHVLALLLAAIFANAVSGIGGVIGYKLAYDPEGSVWTVWWQWVASGAIGVIAVAPAVIGFAANLRAAPSRHELGESVVALIAVAAASGIIIFMLPPDWWETSVAVVLLFPLILWVAARCRPQCASAAVFIVSLVVMATVTLRVGNFGSADSVVSGQVTILGTALSALILSALFAERRQHEAMLEEGEKRLQEALTSGAVMAFEWDASTDLVRRSNNAAWILGLDPQQAFDGKSFQARVHPDDLARMRKLWSTLNRDNSTYSATYRFLRLDGREVWLQETSEGEFDAAGRLVRVKGLKLDITDRKRAEEHQKFLMAELDHRVKNVLARVAAVADSTCQSSRSVGEFSRSYAGRIQSMAIAHTLLSRTGWHGADLTTLVRQQLAPYVTGANTTIVGPDVQLGSSATQALAMVLHELATNAVKYGALSTPGGGVSVSWDRELNGSASTMLKFVWHELDGPPLAAAIQPGYGTDLIRNLIPHELGGSVDLVFASDGACCRIQFPLEHAGSEQRPSLNLLTAGVDPKCDETRFALQRNT